MTAIEELPDRLLSAGSGLIGKLQKLQNLL